MQKRIFTSESVTEGHPDKVCDQISDGVLDAILAQDKTARVACECVATTGMVMVMGEISTECYVDIPHVVRETLCSIGYDSPAAGFNGISVALLASSSPIGCIFSAIFVAHITVGGSYMNASLFPSEVADIISGVVIYLCAFALLFKSGILKTFFSGKKQKPAESGKEAEA